jgi:4-diphosphocytidyl-2-C-methyl-D-erythritol kinase
MKINAYAKINLFLRVLGKRPDGYHELETLMQSVTLHDVLTLSKTRSGLVINCPDKNIPAGRGNLVYQAALAMKKEARAQGLRTTGLKINLRKNIPAGAGLGGGSSDAAAAIRGIDRLWRLGWPVEKLAEIGAGVGSDVPFFLYGGTVLARGRGEKIVPLADLAKWRVVIVKPAFSIPTKWAYENLKIDLTKRAKNSKIKFHKSKKKQLGQLNDLLVNDLERVCSKKYPILSQIKRQLLDLGAKIALMSGSGSAVFGIVTDARVEARVKEVFGGLDGYWVWSGSNQRRLAKNTGR